ncbi:MAG TPA: cryptochrome/photolyase family protein [Planctomycetota bacterium]
MSAFLRRLSAFRAGGARRWLFVPYDQLSDEVGPLAREQPGTLGIVLVESARKGRTRPYHKQKLALVLASLRHFALEQAERGVAVRHVRTEGSYADALRAASAELGLLRAMEPAERELRVELAPLVAEGRLELLPHEGWLTTPEQFRAAVGARPPWRMDRFYRHVRRTSGILMDAAGKPLGGKLSFDAENRRSWRGEPPAPEPPLFEPDEVTREVCTLVERRFGDHPGRLDPRRLPASRADVETLWSWARSACLPHFGPFEDAFSARSSGLFHTRLSALMNLLRLPPRRILADVLALELPLASQEGFVRQILGWREFVRHVHRETDGFRANLGGEPEGAADAPARPSHLEAHAPLPPAWWGTSSGLACLDHAVAGVWAEGYSHHIVRLMVLSNLATLLGVEPRELTDWFWVAYTDAYDWVVEPNVLGMGTFAVGELMTTKPYVSGAAYLDRMGDLCEGCRFDPARDCPITPLYWDFLARNGARLAGNARLAMPLRSAARRTPAQRARDARVAARVRERLTAGSEVRPEDCG